MPYWNDDRDRDPYRRLDHVGDRLDDAWRRLDEERQRLAYERERLREMRDRVGELRHYRDDDRWRDRGWRGDDRDDDRDRYHRDIHLEPWHGPEDWNRRRGADWRGPEPADFDMPPRRRR